jgi:putative acetyltransferase
LNLHPASFPTDLPAITSLFRAYAASLPIDLGYQGFDGELASLPGKYAPPTGALLIARDANGAALGCVAMRPLDDAGGPPPDGEGRPGVCEMKRLYVAPAGRGQGLGKQLARAIIEAARAAGHHEMRLDTLGAMHEAQALYRALGFIEIAAYYDTPIENTVFMSLKL